jgi:putative ABC transport system substrate-binding protein
MQLDQLKRRDFITLVGGAAAAWPLAARAQQPAMPVVGFLSGRSLDSDGYLVAAFRQALNESGFVEGRNLLIEFRWADGRLDRLPLLAAELVERKVAVVFVGAADVASGAIKIVAATLPVVFATGSDPVALGLVQSFNRPGGNLTGVTVITAALWPKRLELLRELLVATPLVAVLVNPNNPTEEPATRELHAVARNIGQDIIVLNARTERDFETAFATLVEKRATVLIVADDAVFATDAKFWSRSARAIRFLRFTDGASMSRPGDWLATAPVQSTNTASPRSMSVVSSRATNQQTCHSCNRPSTSW